MLAKSGTSWPIRARWRSAALSIAAIYALLRLRFGLAIRTVRDNEASAESVGVNVWGVKFTVFVLASFITGCAGAVAYLNTMFVSTGAAFSVDWSALIIFVVIIGGLGTIEGPIIGALVYFALREWLADYGTWYIITLGCIAIALMIFAPQGLWGSLLRRLPWRLFPAGAGRAASRPEAKRLNGRGKSLVSRRRAAGSAKSCPRASVVALGGQGQTTTGGMIWKWNQTLMPPSTISMLPVV